MGMTGRPREGRAMSEPRSVVEVDLGAIGRNARAICGAIGAADGGGAALCGVVKGDAYGLGAVRVGKRLAMSGASMLAVYGIEEARALVDAAIGVPVLVLLPIEGLDRSDGMFRAVSLGRVELSVHDAASLRVVRSVTESLGVSVKVHVAVDTGMGRGGSMAGEAARLVREIAASPRLELAGVGTHFAGADADGEGTASQARAFDAWLDDVRDDLPDGVRVHASNTYGTVRSSAYRYTMVRVGIGLYGCGMDRVRDVDGFEHAGLMAGLEPVVRWTSRVRQVRRVPEGWGVGYGTTWRAGEGGAVLAGVPVGYADGYPLGLSSDAATGASRGKMGVDVGGGVMGYAPVVGRVSMDQVVLDVTGIEGVEPGASVEVIGRRRTGPTAVDEIARRGGTLSHFVLCGISPRVPRRYVVSEDTNGVVSRSAAVADTAGAGAAAV